MANDPNPLRDDRPSRVGQTILSRPDASRSASQHGGPTTPAPPQITRRLPVYNPRVLSDAEIVATFVARLPLFHRMIDDLDAETPTSLAQSHLIIGQRGMGKTTLLVRLAAELRGPRFRERLIPLTFPEEQYTIDRLSKLWLNCLDALADARQASQNAAAVERIDAAVR
ncbi:MAG: hypothetical protein NT069_24105, partial [Planctomycetota bacterium]|nr:hypothetical protein [Planctomycetota bacterium]